MSDTVITCENVSKLYLLGHEEKADTFFGGIGQMLRAPFDNFRTLRRLNTYNVRDEDAQGDDYLWALKDVSFEVKRGEVLGIIGRNGAGKSTLLKILSRIAEPTRGRITMKGRVSALLEVGTGFHPELTGRENIYLNGTILGMKKAEIDKKFDEIVDFSGVERFLDTPVKRYSSGMKVRLAFSVAAHLEPEILIVDEVLAVGDAEFQKKCLGKMQDVATGEGRTILFVSHNMGAVKSLCPRTILLLDGHVANDGLTSDSVDLYLTRQHAAPRLSGVWSNSESGDTAVIESVRLLDSEGKRNDSFASGDCLTIEVTCRATEILEDPRFGIVVETESGEPLFFLQTSFQHRHLTALPQEGLLTCTLDRLPLVPGDYCLTVGCSSNGKQVDLVEHGLTFNVMKGPYFSTNELPPPHLGRVLVDANWDIRARSEEQAL